MADVFVIAIFIAFLAGNGLQENQGLVDFHATLENGFWFFLGYCLVSILATQLLAHAYHLLSFAFSITGPVLLLLSIGWFVRHIGMIGDTFIREANTLVYNIAFPVMLFYALSATPLHESIDWPLTLIGLFGTLAIVLILMAFGRLVPADQRGVFIQGGYRGNLAILGVALAIATYDESVRRLASDDAQPDSYRHRRGCHWIRLIDTDTGLYGSHGRIPDKYGTACGADMHWRKS